MSIMQKMPTRYRGGAVQVGWTFVQVGLFPGAGLGLLDRVQSPIKSPSAGRDEVQVQKVQKSRFLGSRGPEVQVQKVQKSRFWAPGIQKSKSNKKSPGSGPPGPETKVQKSRFFKSRSPRVLDSLPPASARPMESPVRTTRPKWTSGTLAW